MDAVVYNKLNQIERAMDGLNITPSPGSNFDVGKVVRVFSNGEIHNLPTGKWGNLTDEIEITRNSSTQNYRPRQHFKVAENIGIHIHQLGSTIYGYAYSIDPTTGQITKQAEDVVLYTLQTNAGAGTAGISVVIVEQLTPTSFLIYCREYLNAGSTVYNLYVKIVTFDTSNKTFNTGGTTVNVTANSTASLTQGLIVFTGSTIALTYTDRYRVITVSGTTVTLGAERTGLPVTITYLNSVALTSTKAIYAVRGNSNVLSLNVCILSGDTITFPTTLTLGSTTNTYQLGFELIPHTSQIFTLISYTNSGKCSVTTYELNDSTHALSVKGNTVTTDRHEGPRYSFYYPEYNLIIFGVLTTSNSPNSIMLFAVNVDPSSSYAPVPSSLRTVTSMTVHSNNISAAGRINDKILLINSVGGNASGVVKLTSLSVSQDGISLNASTNLFTDTTMNSLRDSVGIVSLSTAHNLACVLYGYADKVFNSIQHLDMQVIDVTRHASIVSERVIGLAEAPNSVKVQGKTIKIPNANFLVGWDYYFIPSTGELTTVSTANKRVGIAISTDQLYIETPIY